MIDLEEAFVKRLNTHQTHFEDLVLLGPDGLDELNDKIEKFMFSVRGEDTGFNLTTKIDGSPAMVVYSKFSGYPDNSICLKSFVNNANNVISAPEEVYAKYNDRPEMAQKLVYGLMLAPYIPEGEAWQGDCLFSDDSKKEEIIDGAKCITFQPNKIVYAFSEDNPGYDKIKKAKFGIAFHTVYKDLGNGEKGQSFRPEIDEVSFPDWCYVMSPALSLTNSKVDLDSLSSMYDSLLEAEKKLKRTADYDTLVHNEIFMSYWNVFENHYLADGKKVTIDIDGFYDDLADYIEEKQTAAFQKKFTTLKTAKGRSKAIDSWAAEVAELKDIVKSNRQVLVNLVQTLNFALEIKMLIWRSLKDTSQNYKTYYKSRSKGVIDASMEGIAMSDADGNIVKIVDRTEFSSYNRDPDILSGWEHPEQQVVRESARKLHEATDENDTIVFAFGRLNPPTIGHKKLVDHLTELASSTGHKARLYLSHSVDKRSEFKNPLPYSDKLKYVKAAFEPQIEVVESGAINNFKVLHELYEEGFKNVVFVGGEDRLSGKTDMTHYMIEYNGSDKAKPEDYYNFDSISFESAGERDDSSDDLTIRASASLARSYVVEQKLDDFLEIVPFDENMGKELYDELSSIYRREQKREAFANRRKAFREKYGDPSDRAELHAIRVFKQVMSDNTGSINKADKNYSVVVDGTLYKYNNMIGQVRTHGREILRLQPNGKSSDEQSSSAFESAVNEILDKLQPKLSEHGIEVRDIGQLSVFSEGDGTSSKYASLPVKYVLLENDSESEEYTAYICFNDGAKKMFTPNKVFEAPVLAGKIGVDLLTNPEEAKQILKVDDEDELSFFVQLLEACGSVESDDNLRKFVAYRKAIDRYTDSSDEAQKALNEVPSSFTLKVPMISLKNSGIIDKMKKDPRISKNVSSVMNDFGEIITATAIASAMQKAGYAGSSSLMVQFPAASNYPLADFFIYRDDEQSLDANRVSVSAKNGAGGKATVTDPFKTLCGIMKSRGDTSSELYRFMSTALQSVGTIGYVNKQFNQLAELCSSIAAGDNDYPVLSLALAPYSDTIERISSFTPDLNKSYVSQLEEIRSIANKIPSVSLAAPKQGIDSSSQTLKDSYARAYKVRALVTVLVKAFNRSTLKSDFNYELNASLGTFLQDYLGHGNNKISSLDDLEKKGIVIDCVVKSYNGQTISNGMEQFNYDLTMDCAIDLMGSAESGKQYGFTMKALAMQLHHDK